MSRAPRSWSPRLAAVVASMAIVVAACCRRDDKSVRRGAERGAVERGAVESRRARFRRSQFHGHGLPRDGRGPVRDGGLHRDPQEDHRDRLADRRVPAVRAGSGVPSEGRVQRFQINGIWDSHIDPAGTRRASRTSRAGRHRPVHGHRVDRRVRLIYEANPNYWDARTRRSAGPRVPLERRGRAAADRAAFGQRRRHGQLPARDIATIQGDARYSSTSASRSTRLSSGSTTPNGVRQLATVANEKIRQAIAHGHRPAADPRATSTRKGPRSRPTSRRAPSRYGCDGDPTGTSSTSTRRRRCSPRAWPTRKASTTKLELSGRPFAATARSARSSRRDPVPAPGEPGHQCRARSAGDTTYLDNAQRRHCSTASSCSAGAPTIRIRRTSSTTTSVRDRREVR